MWRMESLRKGFQSVHRRRVLWKIVSALHWQPHSAHLPLYKEHVSNEQDGVGSWAGWRDTGEAGSLLCFSVLAARSENCSL